MSVTKPLWATEVSPRLSGICAYCAEPARYEVCALDGRGRTLGTGYCCDEPEHWAWLAASVDALERGEL